MNLKHFIVYGFLSLKRNNQRLIISWDSNFAKTYVAETNQ